MQTRIMKGININQVNEIPHTCSIVEKDARTKLFHHTFYAKTSSSELVDEYANSSGVS